MHIFSIESMHEDRAVPASLAKLACGHSAHVDIYALGSPRTRTLTALRRRTPCSFEPS